MSPFITRDTLKLIKKLGIVCLISLACSCNDNARSRLAKLETGTITLPSGATLTVYIASTPEEQAQGLSGLQPEDFKHNEAMLFPSERNQVRQFWMPDTHFDLDIVFLNKDFYVLDAHKGLKSFPHRGPQHLVPLSKAVYSRHVLELRADSPHAKEIVPGVSLKWSGDLRQPQTK